MSSYFTLDPDYKDFDFSDKDKLKFLTVYGEQHTFIVLASCALPILFFTVYAAIFGFFLPELGYLVLGATSQAAVTVSCQAANHTYTYAFDITDVQGNEHHNVGTVTLSQSDACPKIGSSITVDYIQGQSKISRPTQGLGTPLLSISLSAIVTIYAYSWIRELLRAIKAFVATRPKLERLKAPSTAILDGVIVRAIEAPKPKFVGRWNRYYVEVEYDFVAYNYFFRGKQVKRRDDLQDWSLPSVGTPVKILYADEHTYVML